MVLSKLPALFKLFSLFVEIIIIFPNALQIFNNDHAMMFFASDGVQERTDQI
jgi:hypothetical protein